MNALFSRITGSLACAMLFLLASNAIGQIHINENPVRQVPDQFGNEYRQTYTNSSVIQLANVYSQYQFRDDFYRDTYGNEYYSFAPYELTNRGLIHEAYVDGGQYWNGNWYQHFSDIINNYGRINHAGVYGGQLTNQDSGSIGTLNSYGGNVTNIGTASIDSLRVEGAGQMHNKNNAYIGALTISSDGSWYGTSYGGTFRGFYYNANSWATNQDNASISSVTIQSGSLENRGSAFIGSVYFMGEGQVDNLGNATIGYAEVGNNGRGVVRNLQNASIDGIDVRNQGRVENRDNASIGTVRIRDNGEIWNYANANIDSVSIENGGRMHNTESASIGAVSLKCVNTLKFSTAVYRGVIFGIPSPQPASEKTSLWERGQRFAQIHDFAIRVLCCVPGFHFSLFALESGNYAYSQSCHCRSSECRKVQHF